MKFWILFHRSIIDNIKYAKQNATFKEVQEIVAKVEMLDVIESLPDQYNTMVGERGVKLSGGQKQRIAIARALLKESPIIVIDEATSNLDLKTENKIKKAIDNLYLNKEATMIIIAHRLSTIKNVDRIIVLDNGQVAEDGNFEELMKLKSLFFNMWNLQFEETKNCLL
jgi:ATP-binding cassette subfamily B protein